MNKALVYVRVSSADQVKGYSLDVQEKACRDYCEREGLSVVGVYRDEGESAKTTDRPELQRLLAAATRKGSGVDCIVIYDLSRLTRDTVDHLTIRALLRTAGVSLRAATQNLDDSDEGEFVETVLSATNKLENRIRRRKVLAGMREAIERGRWVWRAPLGYRFEGKRLVHDDKAPALRWAFEEAARGLASKDELRRELRRKGLEIPRETLYRILRNPFYAGRIVIPEWGLDVAGIHPPLVDLATFRQAARRVRRRRSYVTSEADEFPFRQLTRCTCGRGIAGYNARGRSGRRFPYYRCQRCKVNVAARKVEARFAQLLDGLSSPPGVLDLFGAVLRDVLATRKAQQSARADAASRRLAIERSRLRKLTDAFVYREAIPEPEYRAERAELERTILALEDESSIALSPSVDFEPCWKVVRSFLEAPLLVWDGLTSDRRVTFLRAVFDEGLILEPSGEFRTPEKCLMRLPFGEISPLGVADGTPPEADFEPFGWWRRAEKAATVLWLH